MLLLPIRSLALGILIHGALIAINCSMTRRTHAVLGHLASRTPLQTKRVDFAAETASVACSSSLLAYTCPANALDVLD